MPLVIQRAKDDDDAEDLSAPHPRWPERQGRHGPLFGVSDGARMRARVGSVTPTVLS
jgi:hypothetical protein